MRVEARRDGRRGDRHGSVQQPAAVSPPTPTVRRHPVGILFRGTQRQQLPVHRRAPTPVLKLHCTQPVPDPLVEFTEHSRRLGKLEVRLPTRHIGLQALHYFRQAPPSQAAGQVSDALLKGLQCLSGHRTFDPLARTEPQFIAQELATGRLSNRRLGLVDLQMESIVELAQTIQHSFARAATAHVHIAVVGVAHEAMASRLQFPVHLVQQHIGQQRRQRPPCGVPS